MAITFDTREPRDAGRTGVRPGAIVADRARAFAIARRHSRLVRLLRVLLPLVSIGIVVGYAAILGFSWYLGKSRIKVAGIQVTAEDLIMKDPEYFGINKDGGRYKVQAKRALVGLNQNAPIKLIDITGELLQTGNAVTKLKSKHGLFDNAKSELELFDGIEIDGSNGLTARLSRAMVYSKENKIVSKHPVVASTPTGSVQASAMTMNTKTKAVAFRGAVAVRMVPGAQGPVALGKDPRQPVDIYSDELDVDDAQKTAHFRSNVAATQGETTLKTPYLFVKYEGKAAGMSTAAPQAGASGQSNTRVTNLWARNGVEVIAGADRRITSELADFDAAADTALFVGKVHIEQGKNRLDGGRLFVDRKAGRNRLETPAEGSQPAGRVTASFYQSEAKAGAPPKANKVAAASEGASILGSFKSDPNAPMDIESDTLDMHDASKRAVFNGDVWAQQGGMVIRTDEMTAIYTGQSGFGLPSAGDDTAAIGTKETGAKAGAQIVRVEARHKVLITSKDGQSASADWANFDVKANTAVLGGNVTVMRGKDMAEGPRLKIDLTTGMYRFELEEGVAAAPPGAPVTPSNPSTPPQARACPPGKQCMLFYPKEAKEKAKDKVNDLLKKVP